MKNGSNKFFSLLLATVFILGLSACGGGSGGSTPAATYTVDVTVSGLTGGGLVLQNNGGDDLSISADGNFRFATEIADGGAYDVTVLTQPSTPNQLCTVTNGSGTISAADVSNVSITCVAAYTIGGTVSGLTGSGLVLQNNGGDDLSISADGNFSFATAITDGGAYDVTVLTHPSTPNQLCTVTNGSGTISAADVSNVSITCVAAYTIGGTVSGLSGSGLVLQNSGDDLGITTNGPFNFSTPVLNGTNYTVTILTQPVGRYCSITNASGTVSGADIINVALECSWTKQMGVSGATTFGKSVATDTNGNVYVAGYTNGGLDGNTLTGTQDFFVTKYDSTGVKQYTKQMGVAGVGTRGWSVATDANGNVYVAGDTQGGLDGNTLTGNWDLFVIKYDSTGVKQYTQQLGVTGKTTLGTSVTTDASGNVYVAGDTTGSLDGNTLTGAWDFFVTKYNSSGVKQYTRQLGVAGKYTYGRSVTTDASGNVYVAGQTTGGLDGNTLTGNYDFFVTKYDSTGVKQSTKQMGVVGATTYGWAVATDGSSNVYVVGETSGDLDSNTLTGTIDFFVTKYNSSGVKQYTKQLGVSGANTNGYSVATDASGNVYVAGKTGGNLDGNALIGAVDSFVTKYDSTGVKQYTRHQGVASRSTFGRSVATDASGNVYVAGDAYGGLDGNTLTGTNDFFVTKYDGATGTKQ